MRYDPKRHNRRSIRLPDYNYAKAGAYFVTICCKNRKCLFGKIVSGKMVLNKNGEFATQCWREIPQHFPNTILGEYVVMPNHLHGIIRITGNVTGIGGDADGIVGVENFQPLQPTLPQKNAFQKIIPRSICSIVRGFKIGVTKQLGYSPWQRNYHEHIIRNEIECARIAKYIRNNPILWTRDCFNVKYTP